MIDYQRGKFANAKGGFTQSFTFSTVLTFNDVATYSSLGTYSFAPTYYKKENFASYQNGFSSEFSTVYFDQDGNSFSLEIDIGGANGYNYATEQSVECDSFVPTTFTRRFPNVTNTYTEAGFVNQTYNAVFNRTGSGQGVYAGSTRDYVTFDNFGGVTLNYDRYAYGSDTDANGAFGGCHYDVPATNGNSSSFEYTYTETAADTGFGDTTPKISKNKVADEVIKMYPNPCGLIGWNNSMNSDTIRAQWLVDYNFQPQKVFLTRTTEITSTGQTAVKPTSGTESYYDTENFTLFLQKTTKGNVLSTLETKVESYTTKTIVTDWTSTDSTDWTSTGTSETTQYTTIAEGTTTYSVNELGEAIEYNTTYRKNETTDATTTVLSTSTKETTVLGGTTETTTADRTLTDGTATETTEAEVSTWVEGNSSRFIVAETDVTFTPVFSDTGGFVPTCITFNTSDYSKIAFDIENYNTAATPYFTVNSTSVSASPLLGEGLYITTANVYKIQDFEVMYTVKQIPALNEESYYAIDDFFVAIPEKETVYINNFQAGERTIELVADPAEDFLVAKWTGSTLRWTYTTSNFVSDTLTSESQFLSRSYEYYDRYFKEQTRKYTVSRVSAVLTNKIDYLPIYWDGFGNFVAGWKSYLNNTTASSSSTYTVLGRKLYRGYALDPDDGQARTSKFVTRSQHDIYKFTTEIGDKFIDLRNMGYQPVSSVKEITALYSGDLKAAGWYGFGVINKTDILENLTPYLGMSSQFSGRGGKIPSAEDLLNLSYTNISSAPVNFSESGSLFFNGGCNVDLGEQNGTLSWYRQKEEEELSLFGTSTKLLATYTDTYETVNSKGDPTISASYTFGTYSLYMDSSYSQEEFDDLLMTVGTAGLYRPLVKETRGDVDGQYFNTDSYGADCLGVVENLLSYSYGQSSLLTGRGGGYLYDITAPKNNNPLTLVVPRAEVIVSKYTAPNKFIKDTIVNKDAWATFTIEDGFRRRIELRPLVRVYKEEPADNNFFVFGIEGRREEFDKYGADEIIPYQLPLSLDGWNGPLVTACST